MPVDPGFRRHWACVSIFPLHARTCSARTCSAGMTDGSGRPGPSVPGREVPAEAGDDEEGERELATGPTLPSTAESTGNLDSESTGQLLELLRSTHKTPLTNWRLSLAGQRTYSTTSSAVPARAMRRAWWGTCAATSCWPWFRISIPELSRPALSPACGADGSRSALWRRVEQQGGGRQTKEWQMEWQIRERLVQNPTYCSYLYLMPGWRKGRRGGLKIRYRNRCVGSTPSPGTNFFL